MAAFSENTPLPIAGREVKQLPEPDDAGWFKPFVPPPDPPAPAPVEKPQKSTLAYLMEEVLYKDRLMRGLKGAALMEGLSTLASDAGPEDADTATPSETASAPVEPPLPPPRMATARELFTWIKIVLLAQTQLSVNAAELVAYWVISTWFFDALDFFPCLVISGPAHYGSRILHVLLNLCCRSAMLVGLRRGDLDALHRCRTPLVSAPNSLDKRTADLLSSLTDREFSIVSGDSFYSYSRSVAIYTGEDAETHKIQNSIHIHLAPTNAAPAASPAVLEEMMAHLPLHLEHYRNNSLYHVARWSWIPSGMSSEMAIVGKELGSCILDAPELRKKLVALLKTQDNQRISEMSNSTDGVVLAATQALSHGGREAVYAREIAAEGNRSLESHGEKARLSPEKVGRTLNRLGLPTHAISQAGHGLIFNEATLARIEELAAMYGLEDPPVQPQNFHALQAAENKSVE